MSNTEESKTTTETTTTDASQGTVTPETTTAGGQESWFDKLPEELKAEGSLESFKDKDMSEVVKSYVHAQKTMGGMIRIPSADSPEEVKKAFLDKLTQVDGVTILPDRNNQEAVNALMNKLGRPEKAENYTLPDLEGVDLSSVNPEIINGFKSLAHTIGLTDAQAKACMDYEIKQALATQDALVKKVETNKALLKQMWGESFEQRANGARTMINVLGQKYPELIQQFNQSHETNPLFYEVLAELSQVYRERGHISGSSVGKFDLTPAEASAKIKEIQSDLSGPYYHPSHPEHQAAIEQISELYRKAHQG